MAWLLLALVAQCFAADLTQDDIVVVAQSQCDALKIIQISSTLETKSEGKTQLSGVIPTLKETILLDTRNKRFHLSTEATAKDEKVASQSATAFDGEVTTIYNPSEKTGAIQPETTPPFDPFVKARVLSFAMAFPPKPGGMGIDDASLVSLLKHAKMRPEKEKVSGDSCYVFDAFASMPDKSEIRYATVWLAEEHEAMPLRCILYSNSGSIVSTSTVISCAKFESKDGLSFWFPTEIETLTTHGEATHHQRLTVDVETVLINPDVNAASFRVDFPPGTFVADAATNTTFRVPGSRVSDHDESGSAMDQFASPILVCNFGLAIAILSFVGIRRYRRQR